MKGLNKGGHKLRPSDLGLFGADAKRFRRIVMYHRRYQRWQMARIAPRKIL
jgi:hypothetical protein